MNFLTARCPINDKVCEWERHLKLQLQTISKIFSFVIFLHSNVSLNLRACVAGCQYTFYFRTNQLIHLQYYAASIKYVSTVKNRPNIKQFYFRL